MVKKGNNQEPQEASEAKGLTRRGAIKRIAAGIAGIGLVVVTRGLCSDKQPVPGREPLPGDKPPYGD